MYCQNCGCTNEDDALVCDNCGAELENRKSSIPDNEKRIKIIAIILSVAVVLSAVAAGIVIHKKSDNSNISENQIISRKETGSNENYEKNNETEYISKNAEETIVGAVPEETNNQQSSYDNLEQTVTNKNTTEENSKQEVQDKTDENAVKKETTTSSKVMHKEYRYRDKTYTTSSNSSMNGWICYDSKTEWSNYGSWSNWSTSACSSSSSRQTESRTTYRFYVFRCTKCGNRDPYSTPCDNCKTSQYFKWEELWYPIKGNSMNKNTLSTVPDKYYVTINGARWWFERDGYSDGQGGKGQPSRKEYRYRDRRQIATYYFYKWGNWSDWSTTPVSSSDNREVETRKVY